MVSITGSVRAGVLVAQTAAATVKRVVQELGGKSPNILLPDADFEKAVSLGIASAFRNVGQSCSAPTRMIVPADRLDEVEALAERHVETIIVGDPQDPRTVLGPIANKAQFNRVQQMIAVGMAEGAKLLCGGPGKPEGISEGYFVQPTIFSGVTSGMHIAQEEIFGPVLCVMPYATEEEAVAIANDTVFGLGGHVQSSDLERARRTARQVRSGQVHINHPAWDAHAAFGATNSPAMGANMASSGWKSASRPRPSWVLFLMTDSGDEAPGFSRRDILGHTVGAGFAASASGLLLPEAALSAASEPRIGGRIRALFRNDATIANDHPIPPFHPYFRKDCRKSRSIWTRRNGIRTDLSPR